MFENCEIISDVLEEAHFRAEATGHISYFGNINFEVNQGTSVVLDQLFSPIEHFNFQWTYWFNQ